MSVKVILEPQGEVKVSVERGRVVKVPSGEATVYLPYIEGNTWHVAGKDLGVLASGQDGQRGADGQQGEKGQTGENGLSAFQQAQAAGYGGDEQTFVGLLAKLPDYAELQATVLQQAQTIERQAAAIAAMPFIQSGVEQIVVQSGIYVTQITFPVPFAEPPVVTATVLDGAAQPRIASLAGVTATGCTLRTNYLNSANSFHWVAFGRKAV